MVEKREKKEQEDREKIEQRLFEKESRLNENSDVSVLLACNEFV